MTEALPYSDCAIENTRSNPAQPRPHHACRRPSRKRRRGELAGGARSFFKGGMDTTGATAGCEGPDQSAMLSSRSSNHDREDVLSTRARRSRWERAASTAEGWGILTGAGHAIIAVSYPPRTSFGQVYADCRRERTRSLSWPRADASSWTGGAFRFVARLSPDTRAPAPTNRRGLCRSGRAADERPVPALPPVKVDALGYHYFHNITSGSSPTISR